MIMETRSNLKSSMMAGNQSAIYQVESFLEEFYLFRRNVLNGKTEFFCIKPEEEKNWKVLTAEVFNSIVRCAKKLGIGEKKSPRQDIKEYIKSDAVPVFDPIQEYMNKLPEWDGKNHVAALFGRIPGLTSEQLGWCATWFRSAVAHWLQMDMLHGNEAVPVLIGQQGCGKSTFRSPAGQAKADAFEGKGEWTSYFRQESGRPQKIRLFSGNHQR